MFGIPSSWLLKGAGIVAIFGVFWYAIHSYNVKITAEAVAEAQAEKDAYYIPELQALTKQFNDIETNIIESRKAAKLAADKALLKEKDRADKATLDWKQELQTKKKVASERDSLVAERNEYRVKRLPELTQPIATRDGDSAEIGRLRDFADGLGKLLAKCQQSAAGLRQRAAAAIDRLGEAEATSRALKPSE
jgi:hypothetical protein